MSATEIINELPKLNEAELRAVRKKLLELTAERKDFDSRIKATARSRTSGKRITSLPDFQARAKKIFPRPIPRKIVNMVDRLIAGE